MYLKDGQALKGDGPGKVNEVDTLSSTQETGLSSIEHSQMLRKLQRFICLWCLLTIIVTKEQQIGDY